MGFSFFKDSQIVPVKKGSIKGIDDSTLHRMECKACPLNHTDLSSPKMSASGDDNCDVYILGEAPGVEEDRRGEQFVGDAGGILRPLIRRNFGDYKVRYNNVIRCHPPKNRDPSHIEIECCRPSIEQDIVKSRPKLIIGTGNVPLTWAINQTGINKWHTRLIPVDIGGHLCWYAPILHPAFIKRKKRGRRNESEWDGVFRHSIQRIAEEFKEGLPTPPKPVTSKLEFLQGIEYVMGTNIVDLDRVRGWLKELSQYRLVALDVETWSKPTHPNYKSTMMRPYGEYATLLTIAIGTFDKVYAFPVDHPKAWPGDLRTKLKKMLVEFLLNPRQTKVGHNVKYDLEWMAEKLDERLVYGTKWADTMAQAYVLDSRKGMLSLDTLVLINFGFNPKPFFPLNKENLIAEPLDQVLLYNGSDVKWDYALYRAQNNTLFRPYYKELRPQYRFRNELGVTLVNVARRGVVVDRGELTKIRRPLERKLARIERSIQRDPDVVAFKKKFGSFSPSAVQTDVVRLFKDHLGEANVMEVVDKYDKNKISYSTKEEVLSRLTDRYPAAKLILDYRETTQLLSVFVDGTEGHLFPDGRLHCNYNHLFTEPGRLSADDPNLQNYPKRKNKHIRRMVVAPEGQLMVSADYGAIEACMIAMFSQDPAFCQSIWDRFDTHAMWAERILDMWPQFKYEEKFGGSQDNPLEFKVNRFYAKNQFVFPLFFGAGIGNRENGTGIAGYLNIPEKVATDLYNWFWEVYAGVKKWHKWVENFYERHGYVRMITGRRRYGPLSHNQLINTPVQGSAVDINLEALVRLDRMGIPVVMQIHDDITSYLQQEGLLFAMEEVAYEMCKPMHDFVVVPLTVEVAVGPNWDQLEDLVEYRTTDFWPSWTGGAL